VNQIPDIEIYDWDLPTHSKDRENFLAFYGLSQHLTVTYVKDKDT
jgi:hypothetical protein